MAQDCRNSVAHFRIVGIDMTEIFKSITEFVKFDFKNLRRSDCFTGRMYRLRSTVFQGALAAMEEWLEQITDLQYSA